MEKRYDFTDEDVKEIVNVVVEPTTKTMDPETVEILVDDRIATGG